MSDDEDDFDPFQGAMKEAQERRTILQGIHRAHGIVQEVRGQTQGFILHYLRDMREQAIDAVAQFIRNPSMTEDERHKMQLAVQPYAHLHQWLKDQVAMGPELQNSLEDLDRAIDESYSEE